MLDNKHIGNMEYSPVSSETPLERLEVLLFLIEYNKTKKFSMQRAVELVSKMKNPNGIVYKNNDVLNMSIAFSTLAKFFCYEVDSLNINLSSSVEAEFC